MAGWIKVSRDIKTHWLWRDDRKFKWWIDILLSVNYEDKNVMIGRKLIKCGRGQSVQSLDTWAKEWRVSKQTVKAFFSALERDTVIVTENILVTTRITVCNYDSYQGLLNANDNGNDTANDTQLKNTITYSNSKEERRGDAKASGSPPSNKKLSEEEKAAEEKRKDDAFKSRRKEFSISLKAYHPQYTSEMINDFFRYWSEKTKTGFKMKWELQQTWELSKRLATWSKKEWNKPTSNQTSGTELDSKLEKMLREEL